MKEFSVIQRIKELCEARDWTCYRLAKESGIPYSTLNTMMNKSNTPSIPTLSRLCDGFGITLAQFFSDRDESVVFSSEQKALIAMWNDLNPKGKQLATVYIQGLLDMQRTFGIKSSQDIAL